MRDLEKFQRVCRVFLARLLMVHGDDAPEVLGRMAYELAWVETEWVTGLDSGDLDPPNWFRASRHGWTYL